MRFVCKNSFPHLVKSTDHFTVHGLTLFKGYNVQAFSLSELAALWDCWGSTVKDCAKLQYSELPFLWFLAFW